MAKKPKPPEPLPEPSSASPSSPIWAHSCIDVFLRAALERVERSLKDHRAMAMTDKTERLKGLVTYFRHQKGAIEDLIQQNYSAAYGQSSRKSK